MIKGNFCFLSLKRLSVANTFKHKRAETQPDFSKTYAPCRDRLANFKFSIRPAATCHSGSLKRAKQTTTKKLYKSIKNDGKNERRGNRISRKHIITRPSSSKMLTPNISPQSQSHRPARALAANAHRKHTDGPVRLKGGGENAHSCTIKHAQIIAHSTK